MARKPHPLHFHLEKASGPLTELLHRVSEHQASLQLVHSILPEEYHAHCLHVDLRQNELLLLVDSPVWANRTHYVSATLLEKLNALHPNTIKRVRIQIAPQQNPKPTATQNRKATLSLRSAETLRSAANSITDPALATALQRLARHGTDTQG